jgi:hypothetical protein
MVYCLRTRNYLKHIGKDGTAKASCRRRCCKELDYSQQSSDNQTVCTLLAKSICAFSTINGAVSPAMNKFGECMSPLLPTTSSNTVPFTRDANVQLNSDSWNHATYSQGEIDRLLKLETEHLRTVIEKANNEIEVQFEQVKADLDHTLLNDLKRVDKRLQSLEASLQALNESRTSNNSQTMIILVALSIVLGLANTILLFVHHA